MYVPARSPVGCGWYTHPHVLDWKKKKKKKRQSEQMLNNAENWMSMRVLRGYLCAYGWNAWICMAVDILLRIQHMLNCISCWAHITTATKKATNHRKSEDRYSQYRNAKEQMSRRAHDNFYLPSQMAGNHSLLHFLYYVCGHMICATID